MVRMVQEFSLLHPLIDGQGNFGSVDGDPAAAYRYTEARLSRFGEELLADIDQDTVDFAPNFDGTTLEPVVLPARAPNLLVNGSSGIAVGMAEHPHNLAEVCEAAVTLIKDLRSRPRSSPRSSRDRTFPPAASFAAKLASVTTSRRGAEAFVSKRARRSRTSRAIGRPSSSPSCRTKSTKPRCSRR